MGVASFRRGPLNVATEISTKESLFKCHCIQDRIITDCQSPMQCDQMARYLFNLAIYNNQNLPKSIENLLK